MDKSRRVKAFIEALEHSGYTPTAYSGRGMYGKSCVALKEGLDGEPLSEWEVAKAIYIGDDRDVPDVPAPRQDSLGLGVVLYWPSYEWPQEETNG